MDTKRFLLKFYVAVLICLLLSPSFSSNAHGENWKLYFEGDNGMLFYYDAERIKVLPSALVQVWIKNFPPNEAVRLHYIHTLRKKEPTFPDTVKYTTVYAEIDCKKSTYTILQMKVYSIKDEVLISETIQEPSVATVQPDSMVSALQRAVCAKREMKKKGI